MTQNSEHYLATYFVKSWTADINGNRISPLEYQYIDVLGRSIETRIDGFSGEQIIQRTEYDAFGEILSKSEPYIPGSTIYLSRVQSRDLLGRPTKESLPSWLVVDTTYNGLTTTKTIRGSRVTSQVKTITKDAYGRTQKVVDTDGRAIEYRYDATGNIVEVKLPNQTSITKQYDRMGRVIVNHDPNLGQWRYAYDADGLLVLQEDGNGKRACFSYDSLLRKTKREDDYKPSAGWESAVVSAKASCQGQVPTTTWAYDQGDSGIGKLTSVLHENGYAEEYSYDVYGRQYERSVDVEGMSVVETKLFDDVTGQLREKTPLHRTNGPSVTLAYHYSTNGYLESIRDAEDAEYYYWKIKNQDARGNVTERDIAGGMLSEVLAYQPHDGKRQAQGVKAVYGDRYLFYGSYAYDAKGRMYAHVLANNIPISGPSDPSDGDLEYMRSDFTYDVHDRLVTEKVYDLKVGVEVPLIENHIQYDSSGNVVDRSDVGLYTYGEQCSVGGVTYTPGPNAVTSVAGARESEYCYDAAGNMLEGNGRQVQYSSFNMPVAIQGAGGASASFTYGPDRELIRTVRSSQAKQIDQIQIGEYEYLKVTEAGSESVKERIRLPGGVVLEFEDGQSQQEHYLVSDALGSVVMVADKLGQVVSRYRYDPWGRPRTTDGVGTISDQQWRAFQRLEDASASGFTGHDMLDEIGLVHMGGRVYEPTLGRFLSPDPIVKGLDNVESYNRYSYALNSPLNYTDPTGYSWFGDLWDRFTNSISKRLGSVMALLINPQLSLPVITYRDGGRELARFAGRNKYAGEILSVVGAAGCTFTSIGAPACMSAYQAWTSSSMTYGGGGSTADALFAGTYSGALAYTNATVAHHIRLQPWGRLGKGMAHGARGAYFASFGGGGNRAAWSGFAGGFAEGALGGRIRGALEKQGLDATTSGVLTSALIGGTASEISGGKFAVGAATAAMGYLANEMSEGGDGEDGASTVDYLMRGLQVIGGGGQALLGGGMCYYSVGIACAGGALILTKGIDNMQAGIRGTSSFSEQALIAATGSESAGIMINAGLDIGTSTVGLIRSVPKVNAFGNQVWKGFRHNPSMFEPAYRQMTGYGLGSEFINSSGTLYQTYDGLKE